MPWTIVTDICGLQHCFCQRSTATSLSESDISRCLASITDDKQLQWTTRNRVHTHRSDSFKSKESFLLSRGSSFECFMFLQQCLDGIQRILQTWRHDTMTVGQSQQTARQTVALVLTQDSKQQYLITFNSATKWNVPISEHPNNH